MFYVYILYSESADRFYVGHTNDPVSALAGRIDHIPLIKRTSIYLSINHRINSGHWWSILTVGN
jgi:hypothetical protein